MSYNKTTWQTGDIVTAEKLNKLEDGVADASEVFIIGLQEDAPTTLDTTWKEIHDALISGKLVVRIEIDDEFNAVYSSIVSSVRENLGYYYVVIGDSSGDTYKTDTETGYPEFQEE